MWKMSRHQPCWPDLAQLNATKGFAWTASDYYFLCGSLHLAAWRRVNFGKAILCIQLGFVEFCCHHFAQHRDNVWTKMENLRRRNFHSFDSPIILMNNSVNMRIVLLFNIQFSPTKSHRRHWIPKLSKSVPVRLWMMKEHIKHHTKFDSWVETSTPSSWIVFLLHYRGM